MVSHQKKHSKTEKNPNDCKNTDKEYEENVKNEITEHCNNV